MQYGHWGILSNGGFLYEIPVPLSTGSHKEHNSFIPDRIVRYMFYA